MNQSIKILAMGIIVAISFSACMKHDMDKHKSEEKNIDYPAAYIVNGEDASISVIKLSDNTVSETIQMMNHGGTHSILWPHHIYHHSNPATHQLAIGVPGMDLSLGHTGGMAGHGGKFIVLNAVKGTITKSVDLPLMNHNAIYSPNGTEIWTTQMDKAGKVLVYDASTYALKNTITVGKEPAEVTFSNDGTKAYVSNGEDNTVSIINPNTKAVITTLAVGVNPVGAWPSAIGKMFVDNEDSKTVSVIDVTTNIVTATINLGFKPGYAAYNEANNELWVSNATDGKVVYFVDMGASNGGWMKNGEFVTGNDSHAIAFYGQFAYITNQGSNTVTVINAATHAKVKDLIVGKKPNGIAIKL